MIGCSGICVPFYLFLFFVQHKAHSNRKFCVNKTTILREIEFSILETQWAMSNITSSVQASSASATSTPTTLMSVGSAPDPRREAEFKELFPDVAPQEKLIEGLYYTCYNY
jgi:hypothetical protein